MNSSAILVFTWAFVALVVGLYVAFIVWRVRVDRRRKAAEAGEGLGASGHEPPRSGISPDRTGRVLAAAARIAATQAEPEPVPDPAAVPSEPDAPSVFAGGDPAHGLADLLAGLVLPLDLVPSPQETTRADAAEQWTFHSQAPLPEAVLAALSGELVRLGFAVQPIDAWQVEARRGTAVVRVATHPDDRPGAGGILADVWVQPS